MACRLPALPRKPSSAPPRLDAVPAFKPAYLIHGDDHGRIAERRARLRALAEAESGAQGVELFEGEQSTPEAVAMSLNAMTFAIGRRFLIVDGVEELTAPSAERRAWSLADTLVSGEIDAATRTYLALRSQGERLPGLIYWMSQRLRTAHDAAQSLEAGESAAQVKRTLRMPAR